MVDFGSPSFLAPALMLGAFTTSKNSSSAFKSNFRDMTAPTPADIVSHLWNDEGQKMSYRPEFDKSNVG